MPKKTLDNAEFQMNIFRVSNDDSALPKPMNGEDGVDALGVQKNLL